MQAIPKWLLIPPALALVVFLGPMGRGATEPTAPTQTTQATPTEQPRGNTDKGATGAGVVALPGSMEVLGSLLGVLAIGGVALALFARLRRATPAANGDLLALRQTLRLSPKQRLHAVQFDGRMLVVGESDGRLTLLATGDDVDADAAAIRGRDDEADEGAVPRDLVLTPQPRRTAAKAADRAPRRAATTTTATATAATSAPVPAKAALGDFRALLKRVGNSVEARV